MSQRDNLTLAASMANLKRNSILRRQAQDRYGIFYNTTYSTFGPAFDTYVLNHHRRCSSSRTQLERADPYARRSAFCVILVLAALVMRCWLAPHHHKRGHKRGQVLRATHSLSAVFEPSYTVLLM
jgi:hypothetical protein